MILRIALQVTPSESLKTSKNNAIATAAAADAEHPSYTLYAPVRPNRRAYI